MKNKISWKNILDRQMELVKVARHIMEEDDGLGIESLEFPGAGVAFRLKDGNLIHLSFDTEKDNIALSFESNTEIENYASVFLFRQSIEYDIDGRFPFMQIADTVYDWAIKTKTLHTIYPLYENPN